MSFDKTYNRLLINELFDSYYPITKIIGVSFAGKELTFATFNLLLAYHLKYMDTTPISYIKCYFKNKNGDNIEIVIHPTTNNGSLFYKDTYEKFVVLFYSKDDRYKLSLKSNDANVVSSTVMHCILEFLKSYKKLIDKTTNDFNERTAHGLFRFDPYPNATLNKISGQQRETKEIKRGLSQRANVYIHAFNKIIKSTFPNLKIEMENNYYIIKS